MTEILVEFNKMVPSVFGDLAKLLENKN